MTCVLGTALYDRSFRAPCAQDPVGGTSPLHLAALSGWIRCVSALQMRMREVPAPPTQAVSGVEEECYLSINKG